MYSSFPSITFPNHYTIVTGLYPETHGIVGNVFYDPIINDTFDYTSPDNNKQSFSFLLIKIGFWWDLAEPLWISVVKQGFKSATYYWPGSESENHGYRPSFYQKFNFSTTIDQKIDETFDWLDLPPSQRPIFIALYLPEIDSAGKYYITKGHEFGPDSRELNTALEKIDAAISKLVNGLKFRDLHRDVNIVIVSDHGMTQTFADKVIFLSDYIDPSSVDLIFNGPLLTVYPKKTQECIFIH